MYPEPEMCLDLPTWQEFCGFDTTGCSGDLEIDINSDDLTMDIRYNNALQKVEADKKVTTDYFGKAAAGLRPAGPFAGLKGERIRFSIDPRKKV